MSNNSRIFGSPKRSERSVESDQSCLSADILNKAFLDTSLCSVQDERQKSNEPRSKRRRKRKKVAKNSPEKSPKNGYDKALVITFTEMLYNNVFWEKLPDNYILNKAKPDTVDILVQDIRKVNTESPARIITSNLFYEQHDLILLLKEVLSNWKKFKIKYFFENHCASKSRSPNKLTSYNEFSADKCIFATSDLQEAVKAVQVLPYGDSPPLPSAHMNIEKTEFVEKNVPVENDTFNRAQTWKEVYSFLLATLRYVIPLELFGSTHNFKMFKKEVKSLLMIGKKDVIRLENVMFGVKIAHCRWVKHLSSYSLKSKFVAKIWIWLLKNFVIKILKSFFYITESNHRNFQLFFFRKRDFQSLYNAEYHKLLKANSLYKLNSRQALSLAKLNTGSCPNGVSPASLKFIPKSSGLRPIYPVKEGALNGSEVLKAKLLIGHITSTFFKSIKNVRSIKNFQSSWIKYKASLGNGDNDPVFVVKVDVKDAYGSINHTVLSKILLEVKSQLPEVVRFGRFASLGARGKPSNRRHIYIPVDEHNHCLETSKEYVQPLTKAGYPLQVNVSQTIRSILKMIVGQVIKVGTQQRLLIAKGIAQGACLSSALCELYYSAMCLKYLISFKGQGRILIRCVDDFLFITPNKEEAKAFLSLMEGGISEFGCNINRNKTVHNIDGNNSRILFRGILFCTHSQQLLIPVNSLASYPPRYSLSLNKRSNPGRFLILKLHQITKSRLASLLYYSSYVSVSALISNIWRAGIMAGGRLVSLIKTLFVPRKQCNSDFLLKGLLEVGGKAWSRIKALWGKVGRSLPFPKAFCLLIFLGGVFIMLGLPRHPPLAPLRRAIERRIRKYLKFLPSNQINLLPRPSRKIFTLAHKRNGKLSS